MGAVENPLSETVVRTVVQVEVIWIDDEPGHRREAVVEQRLIRAGESAPYRALFYPDESHQYLSERFGAAGAILLRAESVEDSSDDILLLTVEDEQVALVNGRYVVTAQISNPAPVALESARVVVTVYDEAERVTGYRIAETPPLAAGGTTSVQLEVMPQHTGGPFRHTIHAEGRILPDRVRAGPVVVE